MLWKLLFPHREFNLLYLTAYLSWAAVAFLELLVMPATTTHWTMAALLILFGLLLAGKPMIGAPGWKSHAYLALQTALMAAMLLLLRMLFHILSVTAFLALPPRWAVAWLIIFILINIIHWAFSEMGNSPVWYPDDSLTLDLQRLAEVPASKLGSVQQKTGSIIWPPDLSIA